MENYIFQCFSQVFFDEPTLQLTEDIHRLLQRVNHRPIIPTSQAYKKHVEQTLLQISQLEESILKKHKIQLDFNTEKSHLIN